MTTDPILKAALEEQDEYTPDVPMRPVIPANSKRIARLESQLEAKDATIAELEERLANRLFTNQLAKARIAELEGEETAWTINRDATLKELLSILADRDGLRAQLDALNARIAELEARVAELETSIKMQRLKDEGGK